MNPVEIQVVGVQALKTFGEHIGHRLGGILGDLRSEFGGQENGVTRHVLDQFAQGGFGRAHTIDGGGIPQIEADVHCGVKDFFHVLGA